MNTRTLLRASLLALVIFLITPPSVFAHETIEVGDYEIEVGWLNEPPVAGLQNGIVLEVSNTSSREAQPVENISSLTVTVSYGGQNKILMLQPLGEDGPGQFVAPILPTLPGEYEVLFGGTLGATAVDAHTHVEEVQPADTIQFPTVESAQAGGSAWLTWLSLLIGLIGVGLGFTALGRKR
jgi:hypothetical protein